jgi:hypothetical protein
MVNALCQKMFKNVINFKKYYDIIYTLLVIIHNLSLTSVNIEILELSHERTRNENYLCRVR